MEADARLHAALRTLHTIKSAAMVVPLEPVTRVTHAVEGILAAAQAGRCSWPVEPLTTYLAWLETIVAPPVDVNASLAAGKELEPHLAGWAAAQA